MIDPKIFEDIANKICDAIPKEVKNVQQDIEKTIHVILQSTFTKLDLVTRHDFDVQAGVLAKTRAKLEVLEQKIAELEKQLIKKKTKN